MSYQVLARKYRPTTFQELEGQEHVLQALVNALDNDRLHHAYLFTGTRGVGKTTIARILARCLNCETGVTSKPCGECHSCTEISEGRSIDLIEVDAASRTGVDDMRELLDNVQYMPTMSRFKIYLIDEVHMLSKSSFNAMLKTLEEPPEHVKFLFATTDPKKLPITVLSRCLQFNLKNMSPEQIVKYLTLVLGQETIPFDESALWQLSHAADGSMRDALSLTDQAISFGNNEVRETPVQTMLGSVDKRQVFALLDAIISENGADLLGKISHLAEFSPDYSALLDDLLSVLHRIAIAQAVRDAIDNAQGDRALILAVAKQTTAEQIQLLYQIGLIGQRDLPLAPTARVGFEMVLLRMMSFAPSESGRASDTGDSSKTSNTSSPATSQASPIAELLSVINSDETPSEVNQAVDHEVEQEIDQIFEPAAKLIADPVQKPEPQKKPEQRQGVAPAANNEPSAKKTPVASAELSVNEPESVASAELKVNEPVPAKRMPERAAEPNLNDNVAPPLLASGNWAEILVLAGLGGVTGTLAANCELDSYSDGRCVLKLSANHASLWNSNHEQKISKALETIYGHAVQVSIEVGETSVETPAQITERRREESQSKAVADIENDQHVQQLISNFDGRLDLNSISPLSGAGE